MTYINSILTQNETILAYESMSFTERCLAVCIWTIPTIIAAFVNKGLFIIGFFFVLYIFLWCVISNIGFENAVTNQRVIVKRGIIRRTVQELLLTQVETCEFTQTILGRIFDYGTVIVYGTGNARLVIGLIDRPAAFRGAIAGAIIN